MYRKSDVVPVRVAKPDAHMARVSLWHAIKHWRGEQCASPTGHLWGRRGQNGGCSRAIDDIITETHEGAGTGRRSTEDTVATKKTTTKKESMRMTSTVELTAGHVEVALREYCARKGWRVDDGDASISLDTSGAASRPLTIINAVRIRIVVEPVAPTKAKR